MVEAELRTNGFAQLGTVLSAAECEEITALFPDDAHFRTRIQMERYRFGKGEYGYFSYPLAFHIERLRGELYSCLASIASRWMRDLGSPVQFPVDLAAFLATCHAAGQSRPTPLLLKYVQGDYNCLHQDLYGAVMFPFQVIVGLSQTGADFEGGELMLVEQRPRAQSIGRVIPMQKGDAVVITTRHRPVQGTKGFYKANVKHGVSTVTSGTRYTLGIIFHDAE